MTSQSTHAARAIWIHALTPLHVGSGRGVGFIDLPIIREKVTNWPYVPGSSFKGVLTDKHDASPDQRKDRDDDSDQQRQARRTRRLAFGHQDDEGNQSGRGADNAGSLTFSDARLVCLPVRSLYGTFSWVTCPLALKRLGRDLELLGSSDLPEIPADVKEDQIRVTSSSVLAESTDGKVYFEDLDLQPVAPAGNETQNALAVDNWSQRIASQVFDGTSGDWPTEFAARFSVVSNQLFDYLVTMATEVQARIRINEDTKTVADGQLWYEESLPAESILSGFVWCDRVFAAKDSGPVPTQQELLDAFCPTGTETPLQLGGKASVGRGRVRCLFS